MKLFICENERLFSPGLPADHFERYIAADKIDEMGVKAFPAGYSINGTLDNGAICTIRLGPLPSQAEAERAFRGLCELIGKHSTPQPGTAMIAFNGREWFYQ